MNVKREMCGVSVAGTLTGLGGSNNNGGGYVNFDYLASGIVDKLCYNGGDKLPPGQNRKSPDVLGSTTVAFSDANGGNLPYDGEAGEECTCGVPDGSFFFDTFTTTARRRLGEGNEVDSKAAAVPLKGASYLRDPLVKKSGRVLQKGGGGGGGDKITNTVQNICPADSDLSTCIFGGDTCVAPYDGSDECSCATIDCCETLINTGNDPDPYQCPNGCACKVKVPIGFETCPKDTCSRGGKTCTNWKQFVSGLRYNQTIVEASISVCQGTVDDAACIAASADGTLVQINRQVCAVATYKEDGLPGSDDGLVRFACIRG